MNIEIVNDLPPKQLTFADLKPGDIYKAECNPSIYMKIANNQGYKCGDDRCNMINLEEHYVSTCGPTVWVTKYRLVGTLKIERV